MRERITSEQVDDLSPEQKAYLVKWTQSSDFHLTIGEMIAFLDEHTPYGWWHIERDSGRTGWRLQHKDGDLDESEQPELGDALWHNVKQFLKEE